MADLPTLIDDIMPVPVHLTVADLQQKHELYTTNLDEWNFMIAAYEGVSELKALGKIAKHARESNDNYVRRLDELYGFGYTQSIIDIFTHYLFKRDVKRKVPPALDNDLLWHAFLDDCDLFGSEFDEFLLEAGRYAAIYGFVGIMVDKSVVKMENREEAEKHGVYPYCAIFHPPAILDWQFVRDIYNRPQLAYLKLKDDDGFYRLWWRDRWQIWKETEEKELDVDGVATGEFLAELVAQDANPLGQIPFIWLWNVKARTFPLGYGDVHEIARIDVSMIRNASQAEEIINLAAFPMMRKPMVEQGQMAQDVAGVSGILEFDPTNPNAKPDWLPAEVEGPMRAINEWMDKKIGEIYRAANAGGMAAMEVSTQAKSGAALQAEFQLLNAKLVKKARNLERAELSIIFFWLLWQLMVELYSKVAIERARTYDVENLAQDLENTLTSIAIVKSKRFNEEMQKRTVRHMLPTMDEDVIGEIDDEIMAEQAAPSRPAPFPVEEPEDETE